MTNESDNNLFVVSLNSNKVLEYHRDRQLNTRQMDDLNLVEAKLQQGIHIEGKYIQSASAQEKAVFMANQLAIALDEDNDSLLAVSCAYLATRYPMLKQLKITTTKDKRSIELINDKEYTDQAPIQFVAKKDLL